MSGRNEKMKRLIAERDRIKVQIEALQNQLKGLDIAIGLMNGDETSVSVASTSRPRARNVKETVLTLVENAGEEGITVNGVLDAAKNNGTHLERGTVSSLLSRMRRENVLDMADGKYFVPRPKSSTLLSTAH